MSNHDSSRRKFIKAAAYTAPVIMTLKAAPSFATHGSNVPGCTHENPVCENYTEIEELYNSTQSSGGGFSSFIKSILKIFGL